MNTFSNAPFARLLPMFCLGITASFFNLIKIEISITILITGIIGIIYFLLLKKPIYANRIYSGISILLVVFSSAYLLNDACNDLNSPNYFFDKRNELFIGTVANSPITKNGKSRAEVIINAAFKNNTWSTAKGKSLLYFKDSLAAILKPGDEIIFKGKSIEIAPPLNPGQFDFKYRCSIHRIYHQFYINENDWRKLGLINGYRIKRLAADLRNNLLAIYKKAGLAGQEYAVLSALVLGYDDEIDRETMQAFSASGTLHVLSVSGMHVGIIFTALTSMLAFLERKKSMKIVRLSILLLSLWFYAMLTGLSPSVIRSAMMFSFILIGNSLNRSSNIYNSLALSALMIFIFFDPLMLFEVGLQLSFIAVAGIAFLYPKIYKLFYLDNYLLDKIWSLIAVSIAAQTATFALSIYYFRQFPDYFIPANLIIIPISTIGIFGGIIMLFLAPFSYLLLKSGWIMNKVVYLLNSSALFIQDLPGSVINGISISFFEMILIYFILMLMIAFLEKRAVNYLYSLLIFSIILLSSFCINSYFNIKRNDLLFFSGTKNICLQINKGRESFLLYHNVDSAKAFSYSNNYCIASGLSVKNRVLICLDENKLKQNNIFFNEEFIVFEKYLISIYKNKNQFKNTAPLNPNLVYTSNKSFLSNQNTNKNNIIIINDGLKYSIDENILVNTGKNIFYLSNGAKIFKM